MYKEKYTYKYTRYKNDKLYKKENMYLYKYI